MLVTVQGPQESRQRSGDKGIIVCRYVNSPFSGLDYKLRRGGDRKSQEMERIIESSFESVIQLELYPFSEICINVHILENDGSMICSVFNATTLALMDAGICMKDMLISCSVGFVRQSLCRDLIQIEQTAGGAYLPLALLSKSNDIVFSQLESRLSIENLEAALQEGIAACALVKGIIETGIKHNVQTALSRVSTSSVTNSSSTSSQRHV